jgi:hypothetical protein
MDAQGNTPLFSTVSIYSYVGFDFRYDLGGVLLSTKKDIEQIQTPVVNNKRQPHVKETNW